MGKEKEMSEKQMCLIAYRESYKMMFRSIMKQLQDTELETTTRHGTWNRVWNQQAHVHVCTVWTGPVRLQDRIHQKYEKQKSNP
jgi:hypothetical protein